MISLDEEDERLLRRLAEVRYHGKKGSLSAVVAEGIEELAKKEGRVRAARHQLELMRKGFDLGFGTRSVYKARAELYERRTGSR